MEYMSEINFNVEDIEQVDFSIGMGIKEIYPPIENLEVTPTKEQQVFTHENSYGYDNVTVKAIGDEYIIPNGILELTANGTHNVREYENVDVNVEFVPNLQDKEITPTKDTQIITSDEGYDGLNEVKVNPIPNNYIEPSGSLEITENGTYNVKEYEEVTTNIASSGSGRYAPRLLPFGSYGGTELDYEVANLDTKNMTSLKSLFQSCKNLTRLDVNHFDTSNVTSLERTFQECSSLTELDLSNWDVSKVTTTSYLFYGCTNLKKLNLSNWVETKLTTIKNAGYMFVSCSNLTTLIIDSPAVLKVTTTSFSYSGIATGICTIYVPDNMVATYQADTYWGTYANQIKGMSEYTG